MRESEKYPVGTLIGGRDCGKTTYMKGDRTLNITGFIEKKVREQGLKGVIILDTVFERSHYSDVKKIKHPSEYVSGPVHLIVDIEKVDEIVSWIRANVRDTFIMFEDSVKLVPDNFKNTPHHYLVVDSKNIHCPIWFQYHSWMDVPKALYSLLDKLVIFKIKQHPLRRKADINNYEEVLEAYENVMANESPFYNETVNNGA